MTSRVTVINFIRSRRRIWSVTEASQILRTSIAGVRKLQQLRACWGKQRCGWIPTDEHLSRKELGQLIAYASCFLGGPSDYGPFTSAEMKEMLRVQSLCRFMNEDPGRFDGCEYCSGAQLPDTKRNRAILSGLGIQI